MSEYTIDTLELFKVACLLPEPFFVRAAPTPAVIFVAGRAKDDYDVLLEEAVEHHRNFGRPICIPGHDGSYSQGERVPTGYPGYKVWARILNEKCGVLTSNIFSCVVRYGHEKITHTREEADGFVLQAQQQEWRVAWIVAHEHQMPRLMCCLLKSCQELDYPMCLRPLFCSRTNYQKSVYGSLGQVKKPRAEHIAEEFTRLGDYIRKGYCVPLRELLEYLTHPDPLAP